MKFLIYNKIALGIALLIGAMACSRESTVQTEKAGSRLMKKEEAAIYFKDTDPAHYPNWQLPVQKGMEYNTYVKYFGDSAARAGDSASLVIFDPSRDEYEIFTFGGQIDSMLGHRVLGMWDESKVISVFVPQWPGSSQCVAGKPEHKMDGDKHIVTFRQDCSTKDTSGAVVPGTQRRLEFEITVR